MEEREAQQQQQQAHAKANIEKAQQRQQEDYLRRRAHNPRTLVLGEGEMVMERCETEQGKLGRAADGPFRFLRYSDRERAVCVLEDSEGRSWNTSAQRVRRWVQRQPAAAAVDADPAANPPPAPHLDQADGGNHQGQYMA